jgi:hypothetical protein
MIRLGLLLGLWLGCSGWLAAQEITPTPNSEIIAEATPALETTPEVVVTAPAEVPLEAAVLATYTARDRSFKFDYLSTWQIEEQPYLLTFTGMTAQGPLVFVVFRPWVITLLAQRERDPVKVLTILRENFAFVQADIQPTSLEWRKAALASADLGNGLLGYAFVMQMSDGRMGMVVALTDPRAVTANLPLIEQLVLSYDKPGDFDVLATQQLQQLPQYAADWQTVIAELQRQDVIGSGGKLLDYRGEQRFQGAANQYIGLAERFPTTNFVLSGNITFTTGSATEFESCSLMGRITARDNSITNYMEVGINNGGSLFYFDLLDKTRNQTLNATFRGGILNGTRLHVLAIVFGGRMTVYLNGRNVADNALVGTRRGGFALAYRSQSLAAHCLMENVWVYEIERLPAGPCFITSEYAVNARQGPATTFEASGRLNAYRPAEAVAYARDAFGLRWWRMTNSLWVREDVVGEEGGCDVLPEIRP